MKILRLFIILLAAANLFFLSSCGDDDDDDGNGGSSNEFTIGGETYALANGYLEEYGANSGFDSYDWDIILTSSGLTASSSGASGTGNFVYLDLNTSSSTGLVAGTYQFSNERDVNTIVDAEFGIGYNASTEEGDFSSANGGTVTLSISGNTVTITFDLDIAGGGSATGEFSGQLEDI